MELRERKDTQGFALLFSNHYIAMKYEQNNREFPRDKDAMWY